MADADWQCGHCGKWYVVTSLARDCEHRDLARDLDLTTQDLDYLRAV